MIFLRVLAVSITSALAVLLLDRYLALCEPERVVCDGGETIPLDASPLPKCFEDWRQEKAKGKQNR